MKTVSRWLIIIFVMALLALLAGGAWFYRAQERHLQARAEEDLAAIAQLKADQVARWRAARLAEAAVLIESPFAADSFTRWLANPVTGHSEDILVRFRSRQKHSHYRDVLLVDPNGQVRLSLSGRTGLLYEDAALAFKEAFRDRRPVLSELHAGPGDLPPHMDIIAPLFSGAAGAIEPLGAVIFQSDLREFLYPMIETWPGSSTSAETILIRRDGDTVLFLNELRNQKDTAFKLRIPLSRGDMPAVMAVLGREGVVQGRDYRGVGVMAAIKAVPDSPWFIVAEIDAAEVFEVWRSISILILALILAVFGAVAGAVGVVLQRNAKVHYQALLHAETARSLAGEEVRKLNVELEQRVEERTAELRKAQEKLIRQERLAVLGQMAGGLGHELRNPLAVMANAVYFLRLVQPDANEKVKEYLGILKTEIFSAEKIISDLLDFSRVKTVERKPVIPSELTGSTMERFPAAENITVKLDFPAHLPAVYVDPRQMTQVLGNLVVNACQAMPEGGTLTVSARREKDMVAIAVTDTGAGIAPEDMGKLFEPLFTTKTRGIGLGLAVSRKLAEANGGRIEARSEAGRGAAFTVYLPVYKDEG